MIQIRVEIVALVLTVGLALIAAYVKLRGLRLRTHDSWHTRSALAKSQLDDRSLTAIFALQERVSEALDELSGDRELEVARIDPKVFVEQVTIFQKLQDQRNGVDCLYRRMKVLAPWIARSCILALLAIVLGSSRIAVKWNAWPGWSSEVALGVAITGCLPLLVMGSIYLRDGEKLGRAVMAGSGDDA